MSTRGASRQSSSRPSVRYACATPPATSFAIATAIRCSAASAATSWAAAAISALPFYTPKGSFWTNSIGRLAAKIDRENRPDSLRCGHAGYQSVALVPLRAGKQILGLLQCNDRREGRWTPAAIAVLEKLADALALAIGFLETRENLCAVHSELEQRVRERTAALLQSNEQLKREVQHRRRIEARLRKSEEHGRRLLETSPSGITECDLDGTITYSSKPNEHMLGYAADEMIGQKVWQFAPSAEAGTVICKLLELAAGDPTPSGSWTGHLRQGWTKRSHGSRLVPEVGRRRPADGIRGVLHRPDGPAARRGVAAPRRAAGLGRDAGGRHRP